MWLVSHLLLAYSLLAPATPSRKPVPALVATESDSAASAQIREELRGYYRDLHDRNWTSIVTHFYPAKVTARFAVPSADSAWSALRVPAPAQPATPETRGYCAPTTAIAIIGHWARVLARRCTGEADEAWLYSMSGRWKIIHLESGAPLTTT
jgi:hypothetical protein